MSFFQSENESEDEKGFEKKTFSLSRIKRESKKFFARAPGKQREETVNEPQLLSEEQELEQLRKHSRYQTYAASKKIQQEPPPVEDTHKSVQVLEGEEISNRIPEYQSKPHLEGDEIGVQDNSRTEHAAKVRAEQMTEGRQKRRRINPGVDPKIINDSSSDESSESDEELLGPSLPISGSNNKLDILSQEGIPIQSNVHLGSSHNSYVTAITIDNAGNRLVSVSLDSNAKLWDFNSMSSTMTPFRTINPLGESPLRSIEYSTSGGLLLCSGRANSAIVMDREGVNLAQTTQGDMYIVDSSRTKGHTASVAAAKWSSNPDSAGSQIVTTSMDGTIRVWDVNRTSRNPMAKVPLMTQLSVKRLRNRHGSRIIATAFDWMLDSYSGVFGCSDGTIKVLDIRSNMYQPEAQSAPVVRQNEDITGICCAPPSTQPYVLARSSDDCLRVYDFRLLKEPLASFENLPNSISETNVCFLGPSGDIFATGTSTTRKTGGPAGSIRMFSLKEMKDVKQIDVDRDAGSVICIMWKESLNQLIVGTGSGRILVYYDTVYSHRGVLKCLTKTASRKVQGVASVGVGIVVPGSSLFNGRGMISANVSNNDAGTTPKAGAPAMKPHSVSAPVRASRKSASLAQHLSKQEVSSEWSKDPREALLKYADIASKNPRFTKIYEKTQPKTLLAEKTAEEEEEESRKAIYERDRLRKLGKHTGSNLH